MPSTKHQITLSQRIYVFIFHTTWTISEDTLSLYACFQHFCKVLHSCSEVYHFHRSNTQSFVLNTYFGIRIAKIPTQRAACVLKYIPFDQYTWCSQSDLPVLCPGTTVLEYFMMTSLSGIIFGVTSPLWGEFTGHRWILLTRAGDAELWYFLWSAPE